jgi:DNA adenine methylase
VVCDPPYLGCTRAGRTRRDTSTDDIHDMAGEAEHRLLAVVLHGCRGQVLLSGYPSDLYRDLYAGWARASVLVRRPNANRAGSGGPAGTETVWSNRPLPAQLGLEELWLARPGDRLVRR